MKYLYKKELLHYFANPIGYIVVVLFAVFANFLFTKDLFLVGTLSMRQFFSIMPWLLMVFAPALAMRQIAEEKRVGTIDVLKTLPLTSSQVVMAKFLATLTAVAIAIALTLSIPLSINLFVSKFNVTLYLPEVLVGYMGVVAMSCCFVSFAFFISSLTNNQVVAFLVSVVALFLLNVTGGDFFANTLGGFWEYVASLISPSTHFESFVKGVVSLRSALYFASFTFVFLFLTVAQFDNRN